jgi:pyruvate dehydrogenase E1 component alpha subunit
MHLTSVEHHAMGSYAIVGAHLPIAAGAAWAAKERGTGQVSVCFFGDGTTNIGAFHEALNMAALWKLPVVYVIENNKYGMGTSIERASATTQLYKRGEAFGIPGEQVDGMDVLAVKAVGERVLEHARSGQGPYIVEALTYRYRGHSMSDPAKYRTREEVQDVRAQRDPIDRLRKLMLEEGLADEETFKEIDKEVRSVVNDAAAFSQDSPEPDPSELWTDVYAEA